MKGLGTEFLRCYIDLAEGEKDPRNLLLAFSIVRVILIEFDISNHVEVRAGLLHRTEVY
jgi:DNA repair/transcription protein MET18/MMS19